MDRIPRTATVAISAVTALAWLVAALFGYSDKAAFVMGFIPARYVGSEASDDDAVKLGRKTLWHEHGQATYTGLGQRMLTSDQGDFSLFDVRHVEFAPGPAGGASEQEGHA